MVGVAPEGFTGAELEPVDVWLPIVRSQEIESGSFCLDRRGCWWLHVAVRLREGAGETAAAERATAAHLAGRQNLVAEDRYDPGARLLLGPIVLARGPDPTAEARVTEWLAGVALVVLLIACFNVANLLLAREARRSREFAVRIALGVGRGRLFTQRLTETLVLAGLAAGGALLLASATGGTVHRALLPEVAFRGGLLGGRTAAFLASAAPLAALLAGLLPALHATRASVADALRAGGWGAPAGGARTRAGLLVAQAALSAALLVGAGLFVASLRSAEATDLGFDAERVVVVRPDWSETLPGEERLAVLRDARERVLRLSGVPQAGLTYTMPFRTSITIGTPRIPGLDSVPRHPSGGPYANKVGPGFFEAMDLEVVRGRPIEAADEAEGAPPVAVVSANMARAYWPGADPLGRCLLLGDEDEAPPCTTVVGVVEDHRRQMLVEDDPHFLYYVNQAHPAFQGPPQWLVAGTAGPAAERVEAVRAAVEATSPLVRFAETRALSAYVAPQMRSWRLGATLFTAFGALALAVAAVGLYSVLAFDVAARHRELGVRAALGAGTPRLVGMVLRRALLLVAAGTAMGLGAALAASPFLGPLLYRVSPASPGVYTRVALTLAAVALLAGSLPAWRATRSDPRAALQAE